MTINEFNNFTFLSTYDTWGLKFLLYSSSKSLMKDKKDKHTFSVCEKYEHSNKCKCIAWYVGTAYINTQYT